MLEQLLQNFEPILATYGIWVALFFAVMVLGPVAIVIWLQKRSHEPIDDAAYQQSLAQLLQQAQSLETVLSQYQQQSSHFYDATRREMGEILQQQEDCLSALLRLKSEIKSTEDRLPELGHQVEATLEEFEEEITGLRGRFEAIEAWYHGLPQKLADGRTYLHQLQDELGVYPLDAEPIEPLAKRLRALQNQASPQDPIAYWYAVQQLGKEIAAIDPQAVEASVKAKAAKAQQEAAAVAESAPPEAQQAVVNAPTLQTATARIETAPVEAATAEVSVPESVETTSLEAAPVEPVTLEAKPAAPAPVEPVSVAPQVTEAPAEVAAPLADTPETAGESAVEALEQTDSIATQELTAATETADAEARPEKRVEVETMPEVSVPEAMAATEANLVEPEPFDPKALRQSMRADFDKAELQISDFAECLQEFESLYQEYESRFAPETWPEHGDILEHSQYLFQEAMQLLALAEDLLEVPQAPPHRIQLNLLRLQHKYQSVQSNLQHLQGICKELEQDKDQLQSRLMHAASQLHQLRNTAEPAWIMQQAALLKELRQMIERQPLHLAVCQSQLKQIEGEIATQVQVES